MTRKEPITLNINIIVKFRRKANNYEIDNNDYLCYKISDYGFGEDNSNSSSLEEKEEEIISEKQYKKKLSKKIRIFILKKVYILYILFLLKLMNTA